MKSKKIRYYFISILTIDTHTHCKTNTMNQRKTVELKNKMRSKNRRKNKYDEFLQKSQTILLYSIYTGEAHV